MSKALREIVANWHAGRVSGIYSVCSAHELVIEAAMLQACEDNQKVLIEATCNQVNQYGGYTGMTPVDFRAYVKDIADRIGFPWENVVLGGDHLGPNPWKNLPANQAMENARQLLVSYAKAGFSKLHLDASMPCLGDPEILDDEAIAARAASLCKAAEAAMPNGNFVYVIGTEVPIPGGATESLLAVDVTHKGAALKTLEVHQRAFASAGLAAVWQRVLALVVQPGVEFDHDQVIDYAPHKAVELSSVLKDVNGIVFEAHSTDYQRPDALHALVRDGFAILKVGPGLTFAMRESLQALCFIENEIVEPAERSDLMTVLDSVMLERPDNWISYYHGSEKEQKLLRTYSYSDRCRYYWGDGRVKRAINTLFKNLENVPVPQNMLSQFMPEQYKLVRLQKLPTNPRALVIDHIRDAMRPYAFACGQMD